MKEILQYTIGRSLESLQDRITPVHSWIKTTKAGRVKVQFYHDNSNHGHHVEQLKAYFEHCDC